MEGENESLELVECGGKSMVDIRPCFDQENKYLFCCSGECVRVFTVDGGECVRSLSHSTKVVGVVIDEENQSQILSCTRNGVISLWNYENGSKVQEWTLSEEIEVSDFIVPRDSPSSWFITVPSGKEKQLYLISRTKDNLSKRVISTVPEDSRKLSIHNKGHFLAYSNKKKLWIRNLEIENSAPFHLVGPGKKIVLVQCHPTKDSVAIGDELGRICIWHKVLGQRPVYTLYHWHSLPISDLVFSNEGTTMYSGGEEMVVVRWSLQSSSKEEIKDFLPRLGAKIQRLVTSPDSSIVAVCLEDNSIHIASSHLKLLNHVQGFVRNVELFTREDTENGESQDNTKSCRFPVGLMYDGYGCAGEVTKGALIANGRPGHLQFYDPDMDKQRLVLDVVGKNQPPAERNKQLSYFEVVKVAICSQWLATLDHRPDLVCSEETNLKFWKYDKDTESFKLHTWVDSPHSGSVTSLFFRPPDRSSGDEWALLSTSDDGKFKIWELSSDGNVSGKTDYWTCERVGFYRNQPATCGDVTASGNLGVAFGHTLTLWEFGEHRMVFSKSVLPIDCKIRKLQFGVTVDETSLVAVLSDGDLSVWDLSSELCLWRVTTAPNFLCKDAASGLFAASFGSKICLFHLRSPKPTHVHIGIGFDSVLAATFTNGTAECERTSSLYFITDTLKLMCLRTKKETTNEEQQTPSLSTAPKTPFAKLIASSKSTTSEKSSNAHGPRNEADMQLLTGPAHVLPVVGKIGQRFVESCLAKKDIRLEEIIYPDLASEVTFESLKSLYS